MQFHRVLAIKEASLGKGHPSIANACNSILLVLSSMKGNFKRALVVYHRSLAIQEAELGKELPDTAIICHNFGCVLDYKGNYEAALVEHHKSLLFERQVWARNTSYPQEYCVCAL